MLGIAVLCVRKKSVSKLNELRSTANIYTISNLLLKFLANELLIELFF